jgi:hypothetical protein
MCRYSKARTREVDAERAAVSVCRRGGRGLLRIGFEGASQASWDKNLFAMGPGLLHPKYLQMAIERWQALTGREVVRG